MKRIGVFMLLAGLNVAWAVPATAQSPGVAEYARNSREADKKSAKEMNRRMKKAAKQQNKARKKYARAQRKAAKRAKRRAR